MKAATFIGCVVLSVLCAAPGAHAETSDNSLIFSCEKIVHKQHPKEDLGNAVDVEHQHLSDMELFTINVTAFHH